MKYPKRAKQHVAESQSVTIFRSQMPAEWIVRDITERDYGVDMYVELVGKDRLVKGDMVAFQLKAVEQVKPRRDLFTVTGIKRATLNYWLGLPVPVFLVAVCLTRKRAYWTNIKELNRGGRFNTTSARISVTLHAQCGFSATGVATFWLSYLREKRWPDIENAIEMSLMLFNTLGPLVLMCKRAADNVPCSTTVQYLINQHYEHYTVLYRYLLGKIPRYLPHWYAVNLEYIKSAGLEPVSTMYYSTLKAMLGEFLRGYRDCIIAANELVMERQAVYFSSRFPYLYMHLKARPHTFLAEDWYARFYYDEYETETRDPKALYFADFEEFETQLGDLTRT